MRYDRRALKRLREERGLELVDLAKRCGLGLRTLYYLDRGITVPRADTLGRLAHGLRVGVEEFFVRKDNAA